jgi:ribonuclease HII
MEFPKYKTEIELLANGCDFVVGCDEVGVGPVAGPVVAAACVIKPETINGYRSKSKWYYRVRDSKTTYTKEREPLKQLVCENCIVHSIALVEPEEVDEINIHQASQKAMRLAVLEVLQQLKAISRESVKVHLLLDGRFVLKDLELNGVELTQQAVIDGDAKVLTISAASIIAKVHRDEILDRLHLEFPQYAWDKNKGYNTKEHKAAIEKWGITKYHRKSFLKNLI